MRLISGMRPKVPPRSERHAFDADKVARLRAALEEGSLDVDAWLIAEGILAAERRR